MFEKEAKEFQKQIQQEYLDLGKNGAYPPLFERIGELWGKGAEFGYNKANEWHYVKDGLPKTSGRYLVYTGGEPFILDFDTEVNSFGYWVVLFGDDWGVRDEEFETVKDRGEDDVIAWKEIVLPELKESE